MAPAATPRVAQSTASRKRKVAACKLVARGVAVEIRCRRFDPVLQPRQMLRQPGVGVEGHRLDQVAVAVGVHRVQMPALDHARQARD